MKAQVTPYGGIIVRISHHFFFLLTNIQFRLESSALALKERKIIKNLFSRRN